MKRVHRHRSVLVRLVAAVLFVVGFSGAAAAQNATLEFRAGGAERVVVATARAVTASWRENEHGDRIIVSRIQLDVAETLKGAQARTVVLDVDGGTLDGFTLRV